MIVRPLEPRDGDACSAIVAGLPDFFGLESGIAACNEALRTEPGWVAVDDGQVVGFLTVDKKAFLHVAEISWMAVERNRRRGGIGTALIERSWPTRPRRGTKLLIVMTSGDAESYAPTRFFYRTRDFIPAKTFPGWWESDLPLLLVRPL